MGLNFSSFSIRGVDVSHFNGDQAILIGSRDANFPAAVPAFSFSGGNSAYVVAGAIVIE
jgi:hypothetical protein